MTHGAVLRETACLVIGTGGRSKIGTVAVHAIHRERCILVVRMALVARDGAMRAGERKVGIVVGEG